MLSFFSQTPHHTEIHKNDVSFVLSHFSCVSVSVSMTVCECECEYDCTSVSMTVCECECDCMW